MVLNVHINHNACYGRGEGGAGGYGRGGRERLYTYRYAVTTRMIPALKMGSDEGHFNVSVGSEGQSHKTVSTNHNLRPGLIFITSTPHSHVVPCLVISIVSWNTLCLLAEVRGAVIGQLTHGLRQCRPDNIKVR